MIVELQEVLNKVEKLSSKDQLAIARILEDELKWNVAFKDSQQELAHLANEAENEYRTGRTKNENW